AGREAVRDPRHRRHRRRLRRPRLVGPARVEAGPFETERGPRVNTSLEVTSAIVTVLEGVLLAGVPYVLQVLKVRFGNPTPPCIDMWPGNAGTMHDDVSAGFGAVGGTHLFTVRARVAASDNEAQQELLYSFCDDLDPLSVAAALMDDQTL